MSKDTYTKAQLKRREAVPCERALPCPFCGHAAYRQLWHGGGPGKTAVFCGSEATMNGDCWIAPMVTGNTRAQAVARWNVRR